MENASVVKSLGLISELKETLPSGIVFNFSKLEAELFKKLGGDFIEMTTKERKSVEVSLSRRIILSLGYKSYTEVPELRRSNFIEELAYIDNEIKYLLIERLRQFRYFKENGIYHDGNNSLQKQYKDHINILLTKRIINNHMDKMFNDNRH